MTSQRIAFIGLGNMGAPMALNLLKAGHRLSVYDLHAAAVDKLASAGAQVAASPADAAADCDLVLTMLPQAAHVEAVLLGEQGVLSTLSSEIPIVDCSTIDPASARRFALAAAEQGNAFADAPVSGGTGGAAAGTLTFMVGADEALFEQVRPVLAAMGKNIVRCGGTGTGQVAKVCNNLLLAISMIGTAEAMTLGASLGIEPQVLAGILNTSSGRCWSSETYNPYPGITEGAPAGRGYSGGFGVELMLKDLGLATEAARGAEHPLLLGALAQQLYQAWSTQGGQGLDFSSIIRMYPHAS